MNKHLDIMTHGFGSFREFVIAVRNGASSADIADYRLIRQAVAVGLNEGRGTEGGFLVGDQFAAALWRRALANGAIMSRCTRLPAPHNKSFRIPAIADGENRFGGMSISWVDESAPADLTEAKIREMQMGLKKLLGLVRINDELLEDAPAVAAATIELLFAAAAAFTIEEAIVAGSGAGKPLGILNSPALVTVEKTAGQSAATVTKANLDSLTARLFGPSQKSAIWLMGNDVFEQILAAEEESGIEIIETGADGERLINQMRVELSEHTAPLGQAGDILLADLSQYFLLEREPDFISSIHVNFVTDESAFKFRFRADGQPAWDAPITPNNSTRKQSPFVALGARE